MTRHNASKAVSLFELMVVLVVAGILTAFFIYSSQYLIVKTRVSRVTEEHRVLARALQNYEADYGTFPSTSDGLRALGSPIAYIVRVPPDPFSPDEQQEYVYVSSPRFDGRWLIVSQGPDRDADVLKALGIARRDGALTIGNPDDAPNTLSLPVEQINSLLSHVTYDPTNGLVSNGDIITNAR